MIHRIARIAAAVIAASPVVTAAQSPGSPPGQWTGSAAQSDFEFLRDTTVAHGGRASIRIRADDDPGGFASVGTALPAQPYAGHRIRFSVFLRTAALGGGGGAL